MIERGTKKVIRDQIPFIEKILLAVLDIYIYIIITLKTVHGIQIHKKTRHATLNENPTSKTKNQKTSKDKTRKTTNTNLSLAVA